jgi:hypothetical protein
MGAARKDLLVCEAVAGSPWSPTVNVVDAYGRAMGTIRIGGATRIEVKPEHYPLGLLAAGPLAEGAIHGASAATLRIKFSIGSAEEWRMPLGPAPPFEVITLVVENRTDNGRLRLDADEVLLDGAELETGGRPSRVLSLPAMDLQLRAGETRTLRVPATRHTLEVAGAAGREGGTIVPFEVGSGSYALTETGLVRTGGIATPAGAPPIARCSAPDGNVQCRLVGRLGVLFGPSTARLGTAAPVQLPRDGAPVVLGPLGATAATVAVSVRITSGIDGVRWDAAPALEGELPVTGPAESVLELPFDLLHARVSTEADVERAVVAAPAYTVRFRTAWGGRSEESAPLSIALGPTRPDVWVAISAGTASVRGDLTTTLTGGMTRAAGAIVIENEGDYSLGATGFTRRTPPATTGRTIVRCFIETDDTLTCDRDESAPARTVRLTVRSERLGREVVRAVASGRHGVVQLGGLYPVIITLDVELTGGGAPLTATARAESGAALRESSPLAIAAP